MVRLAVGYLILGGGGGHLRGPQGTACHRGGLMLLHRHHAVILGCRTALRLNLLLLLCCRLTRVDVLLLSTLSDDLLL